MTTTTRPAHAQIDFASPGPSEQSVRVLGGPVNVECARPQRSSIEMPRFLHTMLRVGDMARSIRFYTEVMGMVRLPANVADHIRCYMLLVSSGSLPAIRQVLLRQTSRASEKYDLAFLGYEANPAQAEIEVRPTALSTATLHRLRFELLSKADVQLRG